MFGVRRGLVTLVLATVLVTGGSAVAVATAETASAATQADDAIALDQRFALLPDEPGNVTVELDYAIPNRVISLGTAIPDNATVTSVSGFERRNATYYEWDEQDDSPSITYRFDVNRTAHRTGPEATHGSYVAADVGDWALFTRPETPTDYEYVGAEPAFERASVVDGEGAAGERIVYLGPQETFTRRTNNQTFRLVVPQTASTAESPRRVLDALAHAAERLRVGDRDDSVFVAVAPTGEVPWAVRGFQTGDADVWVRDQERLDDPENVWYHEYVHTRQSFETAPDARWLEEGLAAYYATRLTFEHQELTFEGYADQLARGAGEDYGNVDLQSPETWRGFADYYKGGLAVGHLDRQLHLETGGNRSFQTVFAALNERERVDGSVLDGELARAGGENVGGEAVTVTGSAVNVTMWNRTAHRSAFGQLPARIEYDLPDPTTQPGYRVSGPYRETTATADSPLALATGETITVRARAHNAGGREGRFEATLRINGTIVDSAMGTVAPNETAAVPLEHSFVIPGRYVLSVDGTSVPVRVSEPATAMVTKASIEPETVDQGETADLEVFVDNRMDGPAQRELIVTRNFREVERRTVFLGANETKRVPFEIRFPEPGTPRVAVNGNWPVRIDVDPVPVETSTATSTPNGTAVPPTTETSPGTTAGTGPGLGVTTAMLALALAALLARRRR